MQKYQRL